MKKLLSIFLVAIALLMVACGSSTPAAEEPAAEEEAPAAEEPAAEEEAAAEEPAAEEEAAAEEPAAAEGETQLRVTFSWPTYIDPAVGSDYSSSTSLANLYDTLVFPNGDGGVDPWLAESWDISDDDLTYTFHLRQGVLFHDGSELLASDVVYSYDRFMEIGEGYAYLITGVASVEAPDDYTVEFTLDAPSGLFLPSLVRLYVVNEDLVRANYAAEGTYGESGDYGKEWLLTHDAGSGPYQVVEFPLEEYLLMEKFNDWWNAENFNPNAPDRVRFIGTTETATVRSLMDDGELEITDQWQTIEALEALDAMDGIGITAFPTTTAFYFMMNTRKAPLDDINCRKAVAYAFDYDQAVALEWPGTQQMVGPVPSTVAGHTADLTVYTRDLEQAQSYLDQCQYADSIADYPIEIDWIADVPAEEKFALLFQANMADIGIPVEIVSSPWLSVVENTSAEETSPHIVTIYVSTDLPEAGLMLQQRYHSSTANTWQQNEWLLDPEIDAAIEDALATVDTEERYAKYAELQAEIADLAPSLFVYDQMQKHAVVDYVDWTPDNNSPVMGYQIYVPWIGVTPP